MQNIVDFNKTKILPRCNPTHGHYSAEVILILTPDQPGYGYTKSKIENAMGGGHGR
jgi:hypothetical protein